MAKQGSGECVYCGEWRKLTVDHIPPKGLCSKPLPSDLVKVPSCSSCNTGASLDDEYFKTVMVLKDKAGGHAEAEGVRPSVFRGLQMPSKLGFAQAVFRTIRQVPVRTPSGLHLGRQPAFEVELGRLCRVVDRITRGLFWHHQQVRVPGGFEVAVYAEDGVHGLGAREIERIPAEVVIPALNNPPHSVGRGVMRYWYALASDRPYASAWIYEFYEDVRFAALVMPAEGGRAIPFAGPTPMPASPRLKPTAQRH
ncbi:MAG: hypothetical protein ACHQZS_09955 [Candidatus Binatales bacterium]